MNNAWIMYLLGAMLCLVWKWQRYCYESKGRGIPFRQATIDWLEVSTRGSQVSWAVTIGIVWVTGTAYVDRIGIDLIFDGVLRRLPVHISMAFLLGALAELCAPAAAKWIMGKVPFAGNL